MGIHTFDEYVLDEDRRELRRGVDAVSVEPQVFDVLLHLLEHRFELRILHLIGDALDRSAHLKERGIAFIDAGNNPGASIATTL